MGVSSGVLESSSPPIDGRWSCHTTIDGSTRYEGRWYFSLNKTATQRSGVSISRAQVQDRAQPLQCKTKNSVATVQHPAQKRLRPHVRMIVFVSLQTFQLPTCIPHTDAHTHHYFSIVQIPVSLLKKITRNEQHCCGTRRRDRRGNFSRPRQRMVLLEQAIELR